MHVQYCTYVYQNLFFVSIIYSYSVFTIINHTVMDSGNDGGTLGTTAGSDCCCCWHDMLAQNHQERSVHYSKPNQSH